jgi:large subunit ribosomal protein L24
MTKFKIKKGDTVKVIAGSQKGKSGPVTQIITSTNRAVIEGVNMPAPIHISNLALLDPSSKTPTRVGYKMEKGQKVRYSKKSGEIIK